MDYEKKYKEALNWMRSIYPTMQGADREDAEHHFPELCESEDERIRKEIIEYITRYKDCITDKEYDSWIAWLEKQGEQKTSWSEEDENHVKSMLSTIECCKVQFPNSPAVVEAYNADAEWLKSIKGRIQPKREWSEEDELVLKQLIYVCHQNGWTTVGDWLKSLEPNYWKPSEKQMQALKYEIESTSENSWQRKECEKLYNDLQNL